MSTRRRRPDWKGPRVSLTTWVPPDAKDALLQRCALTGIPVGEYLTRLIQGEDVDAFGVPRWHDQQEQDRSTEMALDLELPLAG